MQERSFTKHMVVLPAKVTEGGGARNNAFAVLLKEDGARQDVILQTGLLSRLLGIVRVLFRLLYWRKEKVFIHYGTFYSLLGSKVLSSPLVSRLIHSVLLRSSRRNLIFLEVNDLPYEQAVDLELPPNDLRNFDRLLFSIDTIYFVFASVEMSRYARSLYGIAPERALYMINGSWAVDGGATNHRTQHGRGVAALDLVYAGTLNKGRRIEAMISAVQKTPHRLCLMGDGGEWLDTEYRNNEKIVNFGALPEPLALRLAASFDLGLIPYDQSKMYYNMCFPTKASFYHAAGLPFLSTPLVELMNHFYAPEAFFCDMEKWTEFLSSTKNIDLIRLGRATVELGGAERVHWQRLWQEFRLSAQGILSLHPLRDSSAPYNNNASN